MNSDDHVDWCLIVLYVSRLYVPLCSLFVFQFFPEILVFGSIQSAHSTDSRGVRSTVTGLGLSRRLQHDHRPGTLPAPGARQGSGYPVLRALPMRIGFGGAWQLGLLGNDGP